MANDQGVSYGARPFNAPDNPPKIMYYRVETSTTIQYFRGQFVVINSNGRIETVIAGNSSGTVSCGVIWDFLDLNMAGPPSGLTSLSQGAFLPASTDAYAGVIYDPLQLYIMEEDTAGTAINISSLGLGVSFTYTATTGNTNTGFANSVISTSAAGVTTQNLLQLMNVYNITNQDGTTNAPGDSCKWVVRIMRHQFGNACTAVPQALTV